ncbi:ChaN family lipoprotein [Pseudoalteromonas luteoviolacea]|uniref:ChaN family lipoprotein n=1 Tax=Pseudoalteromonas luteoviolacea TaxID=43657 RepID=UPI001B3586BA|nr:ChaN family lipoprotein [Pseudoalteromonas luteoviolacea]MBQ4812544.1 ChaN family lipoprotein [Pseudoalteromonas luteoviolacea]
MNFRNTIKCLTIIASILSTQGCSTIPTSAETNAQIATMQDYQLYNATNQSVTSLNKLRNDLADSDVIFIGEYHSHSASHRLQTQLLNAFYQQNNKLVLSMEQFTRDKQDVLDQYLRNEIGEQTLIKDGDAWDNYPSDYRQLVEFAKEHSLPVIGANTPISIVRCVARKGPEFINSLDSEKQNWVAADITSSSPEYQNKFTKAMSHHGGSNKKETKITLSNSFYAQLARDNTMADSIYKAHLTSPDSQIVHFNGAFHSNYHLGTVDALKRIAPELKIAVISPQFSNEGDDWNKGDYIYKIKSLPTRYIKKENRDKAIKEMMSAKNKKSCVL